MKINTKYIWLKSFLSLLLISAIIVGYFYFRVPFKGINHRAVNQQYKALHLQNKTVVYIPYQLKIANNRLLALKLQRIDDESSFDEFSFYDKLIFSDNGIKIEVGTGKNEKGSRTIFPFTTSTFYYFKRHTLANNNPEGYEINPKSFEQLSALNSEPAVKISERIIDSLYQSDTGKRFNVHFGERQLSSTKVAKLKINEERQQQVILADTLKGMDKEAAYRYLLKYASTDIRENLKDF